MDLDFKYDHINDKKSICDYSCESNYTLEDMKTDYNQLLKDGLIEAIEDFAVWASADPNSSVIKLAEKYVSNLKNLKSLEDGGKNE